MPTPLPNHHTTDMMYRHLVHGVHDYAIYLINESGQILNWNIGGERSKGYCEREIVGEHFERFFTLDDRALGIPQQCLEQARNTGHFVSKGWRVRKDGSAY